MSGPTQSDKMRVVEPTTIAESLAFPPVFAPLSPAEPVPPHGRHVIPKLPARNRVHAIAIALERGAIALDSAPEDR